MTECTSCGAETTLYLCPRCEGDLADTLTGLAIGEARNSRTGEVRPAPSILSYLRDAALGDTRLGESERRSTDLTSPMPCNLSASQLYDDIHWLLNHWVAKISTSAQTLAVAGESE